MKLHWTVGKMAKITGGVLQSNTPDTPVTSIVTDSRVVSKGDCFVALKGEHFDASEFIPQVLEKGASVVIAPKGYSVPAHTSASFILVKDTLKALQALAKSHRQNSTLKVVAITGSNGKSTTKQMMRAICSVEGETVANVGNLNNQFGVPFSLLEIQPKHRFGVFELGASHPGDIDETASLTMPNVAIITNVGPSHLEFFHDLETVYKTKSEIAKHLLPNGTLVYNADDKFLSQLDTEFQGKHISFGFGERADLRILETENFAFTYKGEAYLFDVKLERHDKLNAAAACAAALALKLPVDHMKQGLAAFTPMPMRLERISKGNTNFILDCYNANPASMQNALAILGKSKKHPRIAVLGDMKELGPSSKEYHRLVARQILDNGVNYVFLAGPEMKYAYERLQDVTGLYIWYGKKPAEWIEDLKKLLHQKGGTCLIKASHSMNFETIFKEI